MGAATAYSKLKRPDDPRPTGGLGQYNFAEDAVDELSRARQGFVKNTGGTLRDVTTATNYQKLSESQKKEYKKRNPQDFKKKSINKKSNESLGKTSLLGKI